MNKIAVFDDHPIVKLSIEALLSTKADKFVFYDANSSSELVRLVNKKDLDLLLFDVNYPGEDTLKLLSDCLIIYPDLKVLVFSSNLDELYGKRYLKAGALGYLNKSANSETILKAIYMVLAGRKYLSEAVIEQLSDQLLNNKPENVFESLSDREFEICMQMIKGVHSSEIARVMNIKLTTVATYKHRIFDKLDVNTLIELYELHKANQ